MSVTPERLAEKRLRAEQLRQEIATLEIARRDDQSAAELVRQDAALDAEIARLEAAKDEKIAHAQRETAILGGGGSVAEALAAMEEAQVKAENAAAKELPNRPALGSPTNTEGEGK